MKKIVFFFIIAAPMMNNGMKMKTPLRKAHSAPSLLQYGPLVKRKLSHELDPGSVALRILLYGRNYINDHELNVAANQLHYLAAKVNNRRDLLEESSAFCFVGRIVQDKKRKLNKRIAIEKSENLST